MYVKEVLVQNKAGLHARPATFFIQKANEYKSTIWVEKETLFLFCLTSILIASLLFCVINMHFHFLKSYSQFELIFPCFFNSS